MVSLEFRLGTVYSYSCYYPQINHEQAIKVLLHKPSSRIDAHWVRDVTCTVDVKKRDYRSPTITRSVNTSNHGIRAGFN